MNQELENLPTDPAELKKIGKKVYELLIEKTKKELIEANDKKKAVPFSHSDQLDRAYLKIQPLKGL